MKFKNIHFIVNPAAGSDEPVIDEINKTFQNSGTGFDISITKKAGDGYKIARSLIGKTGLVAVYGGDGSITEVAAALYGSDTPIGIIPGGTANVMAKELCIPVDLSDALELLKGSHSKMIAIDMGMVNKQPFMLRVNLGIMADMIINAQGGLKDKVGQLAYGVSAVESLFNATLVKYKLTIDGKEFTETGVTLTVTNSGSLGIGSFALLPGISIKDGLLDLILMCDSNFLSVLKIAGSTLFQNGSEVLKHWKCKEVVITMNRSMPYICDDKEKKAKRLHISVMPKALKIVVPSASSKYPVKN